MKNVLRAEVSGEEIRVSIEQPLGMPDDAAETDQGDQGDRRQWRNSHKHGRTPFYGRLIIGDPRQQK